jgi:hypothetical protein
MISCSPYGDLTNGAPCASRVKVEGQRELSWASLSNIPGSGTDRINLSLTAQPHLHSFAQNFSPFSSHRCLRCYLPALIYHHDLQPLNMVGPRKRGADAEEEELVALPSDEEDDEEEEE